MKPFRLARITAVSIPLLLASAWAGHQAVRMARASAVEGAGATMLPSLVDASGRARHLGDFLADYWGTRWPEARLQLLEQGADLDEPVGGKELLPWEMVRPSVRDSLAGDGFPLQDFARYFRGFGGGEGREVDDEEVDPMLRSLADEAAELLRLALEDLWACDGYERAPLAGPVRFAEDDPREEASGLFTYTDVFQQGGWVIEVRFDSADNPDLEKCLRDIQGVRSSSHNGR